MALTVGDLREMLLGIPDHTPVILQKDAEGNGHSPLEDVVDRQWYIPESSWGGFLVDPSELHEFEGEATPTVVLYPVN